MTTIIIKDGGVEIVRNTVRRHSEPKRSEGVESASAASLRREAPSTREIWMTQHEIAALFGVFVSAITANIRSIFKAEILDERRVMRTQHHSNGNLTVLYNFKLISALSFRLHSRNAGIFRKWLLRQALAPTIVCKIPAADDYFSQNIPHIM